MTDRPKRPRDANQLAKLIVDLATGEAKEEAPSAKLTRSEAARQAGLVGAMPERKP